MADLLPDIRGPVPGPQSKSLAERLERVECPEVTCLSEAPIFWERARGSNVQDVDGNRYVDLLAGFGVAALGYAHPELVATTVRQSSELMHAMGDVYPARLKVELLEELARVLPGDLGSAILSSSGSDAVESALKTAMRVTGRTDVIAFEGAYHGLGFGALSVTHRAHFRAPFEPRLPAGTHFAPFGDAAAVRKLTRAGSVAAILFEPIQGRGGLRIPPEGFMAELREIADECGALLIADEVYTGLARTGSWLACESEGVIPDVVALGKALGAGFPISACVGRRKVMAEWGKSDGEAIHTSTHLGNPLGCALALDVIRLLEQDELAKRSRRLGMNMLEHLQTELQGLDHVRDVRGRGLMFGIELFDPALAWQTVQRALARGWILLVEGDDGCVLSMTPPLNIDEAVLETGIDVVIELLRNPA